MMEVCACARVCACVCVRVHACVAGIHVGLMEWDMCVGVCSTSVGVSTYVRRGQHPGPRKGP